MQETSDMLRLRVVLLPQVSFSSGNRDKRQPKPLGTRFPELIRSDGEGRRGYW